MLTDQRFQPISRVSVDRKAGVKATEETLGRAQAVSFVVFFSPFDRFFFRERTAGWLLPSPFPMPLPSCPRLTDNAPTKRQYLYFPCGIIRGALAGLGMDVTVHADSSEIPAATFQIKTRGAKA